MSFIVSHISVFYRKTLFFQAILLVVACGSICFALTNLLLSPLEAKAAVTSGQGFFTAAVSGADTALESQNGVFLVADYSDILQLKPRETKEEYGEPIQSSPPKPTTSLQVRNKVQPKSGQVEKSKQRATVGKIQPRNAVSNQKTRATSSQKFLKQASSSVQTDKAETAPRKETARETIPASVAQKNEGNTTPAQGSGKTIYLFNTVALFPKKIGTGAAPQWERVVNSQKKKSIFTLGTEDRIPPKARQRWIKLKQKVQDAPLMQQMREVNTFFNSWPYRTDPVVWGVAEYWATPEEFMRKSGDCEDYAIAKYYALRSLGVPAEQMRIVAVKETIRGIGHAVLVVFTNDTAYVLDNLSSRVLEHTYLTSYLPQFSVNEYYRWGHARVKKKHAKK